MNINLTIWKEQDSRIALIDTLMLVEEVDHDNITSYKTYLYDPNGRVYGEVEIVFD